MTVTLATVASVEDTLAWGGAVMETSGGAVYVVAINQGSCQVYSISGTTATLEDSDGTSTIFGTASVAQGGDAYIDSSDLIHIVMAARDDLSTYDFAYATFNTGTDTLSSWEDAGDYNFDTPWVNTDGSVGVAIAVDSSDIPYFLYVDNVRHMGQQEAQIQYTKRTGGTWDAPELVNGAAAEDFHFPFVAPSSAADDVEAIYRNAIDFDLYYIRRNASWGTENSYTGSMWSMGVINEDSDTTYRLHLSGTDLYLNNTDTTLNVISSSGGYQADITYASSLVHLAFVDASADVQLYRDDGASGWELVEEIFVGTATRVRTGWTLGQNLDVVHGLYTTASELTYFRWDDAAPRRIFVISHGK